MLDLFDQKRNFLEICRLQDLEEWLRHWDRASWTTDEKVSKGFGRSACELFVCQERRGELDKGQILRALCEVGLPGMGKFPSVASIFEEFQLNMETDLSWI